MCFISCLASTWVGQTETDCSQFTPSGWRLEEEEAAAEEVRPHFHSMCSCNAAVLPAEEREGLAACERKVQEVRKGSSRGQGGQGKWRGRKKTCWSIVCSNKRSTMNSPRLQKWLVNWSSCPDVEGVYNTLVQLHLNSVSSIKPLAWTKQSGNQYYLRLSHFINKFFGFFIKSLEFESSKTWFKSLCFFLAGWILAKRTDWKLSAFHYSPLWWRQNAYS